MNAQILKILVLSLVVCPLLCLAADPAHEEKERAAAEHKLNQIKERGKLMDVEIQLEGKVVDQNNHPIEGAKVILQLNFFSPSARSLFGATKELLITTDAQGRFSVFGAKGRSLFIRDIRKPGYEFPLAPDQEREFRYSGAEGEIVFRPDPTKPVLFSLRKQGEGTFLLKDVSTTYIHPDRKVAIYECIQKSEDDLDTRRDDTAWPGIAVSGAISQDGLWIITLKGKHLTDMLLLTNTFVHVAPEQGYVPSTNLVINTRKAWIGYLILKTETPPVYCSVRLQLTTDQENCGVYGTSLTNPYGERNFEPLLGLSYEVVRQLTNHAKDALSKGQLATKPDIRKLMKRTQ